MGEPDVVVHDEPPEEPVEPTEVDPDAAQHDGADPDEPQDWADDDA